MIRSVLPFALLLSISAIAAETGVSDADRRFIAEVSQSGLFEKAAGEMAADKGLAQDIRDLGTMEGHDHTLANDKLRSIASAVREGDPRQLHGGYLEQLKQLKGLSGRAFDAAFLNDMKTVHEKDEQAYAAEAKSGTNGELREFAAATERIIERNLGAANAVGPD